LAILVEDFQHLSAFNGAQLGIDVELLDDSGELLLVIAIKTDMVDKRRRSLLDRVGLDNGVQHCNGSVIAPRRYQRAFSMSIDFFTLASFSLLVALFFRVQKVCIKCSITDERLTSL
jgi:hypothetical protein